MWVQVHFQKHMSNLYFSVRSKRREHSAASSEAGRADPRVQVPGHLSFVTEMLLLVTEPASFISVWFSIEARNSRRDFT